MTVDWIRKALVETGKTRSGLAKALGRSPSAVTDLLIGSRRLRADEIAVAVEYLGVNQIVTIEIDRAKVKARLSSRASAKVGEAVGVNFQAQKLVVFNSATGRATQSALFEGTVRG